MRLSPIWQQQILSRLRSTLATPLTIDEKNWVRDGTRGIDQYQSFVITDKILIIYGQQYQHNAYAYGTQTLIYPLYRLADIRK
jgi:Protein of unknown function (DUF3298)